MSRIRLVVSTSAGGRNDRVHAALEGQGILTAGGHASRAVDTLVVAHVPDIHLTVADAGAAGIAAVLIDLHADQRQLVKHAVDGAQRADKTAKRAVAENTREADDQHDDKFAREQDLQHGKIACVARIRQKADGSFKSARRADIFAEARHCQVMTDPVPHGDRDSKNSQDHIFEIRKRPRDAALFNLGRRDLMEELLDESQRTEPAADCPSEGEPEDHDDAQHIPAGAVTGVGERVLDGSQGTCPDCPRAGIAVKARDADSFYFALIDLSVDESPQVRVI